MPFTRTLLRSLPRWASPLMGLLLLVTALLPLQGGGGSSISVWVSPSSTTLLIGTTQQFSSNVSGTTKTAVTWSCTGGSVTSTGLYTAPITPGIYTVKATLVSNSSYVGTSTVTVVKNQIDGVVITTSPTTVGTSQSVNVYATVTGSGDLSGTWSFSDGTASYSGGSPSQIYSYGTYSVSAITHTMPATPGTYTITYTSAENPAQSGSVTITVVTPGVILSPTSAALAPGAAQQFTASTVGLSNTAVTWSCSGGSVSTSGLYTAPSTAGTYTVTATSVQDPTKSATATVVVAIQVTLDPFYLPIYPGDGCSFNATVLGASNPAVAWSCTGGVFSTPSLSGNSTRVWWTAPSTAGHYTLTVTSVADPTKVATVDVPVSIKVQVIAPTSALQVGGTYQAQVQVKGTADPRVVWSINASRSAVGGSITSGGLFTAPTSTPVGQRLGYYLMATSVADPTQSGETYLSVYQPASVTLTPNTNTVPLGASVALTATPLGSDVAQNYLEWEATQGSIQFPSPYPNPSFKGPSQATFEPPRALGTYSVRVAPLTNYYNSAPSPVPGVSATASVTVVAAPAVVTLTPGQVSIETGGTQQYFASVTGVLDPTIQWTCSGGTISSTGLYMAPTTTGTYTITATSKADSTGVASIPVIVRAATAKPKITVSPKVATVAPGGSQSLSATISNASAATTTWIEDNLSGQGTYTLSGSTATFKANSAVSPSSNPYSAINAYAAWSPYNWVRADLFDRPVVTIQPTGAINVAMDPSNRYEFIQGDSFQFKANVTGTTDTRVVWNDLQSILLTSTGSMNTSSGWYYTNPYHDFLIQASSVVDPTRYSVASVRVWNKGAVRIFNPLSTPSILPGQQVQLDVEVKGGGGVVWTATAGTISPTGLYTPPASVTVDTPVTLQATNAINPNYSDTLNLNVRATGSVDVSPTYASVLTGGKQTFTAKVWNSTASVTWTVRMANGSSLNPGTISRGLYTAPTSLNSGETSRNVIVRATNASDTTKWAEASVVVYPSASALPPPTAGTLSLNGVTTLWTGTTRIAYYGGDGDTVTWSITGGTILSTGHQEFGFPPQWYAVYQVGSAGSTATLTAKASNSSGSVSVTSSPITVTAIPDFAGVFTTSTGTNYSILDFGTVTETQLNGSVLTYHKVWVNGTNGSLHGNDISIANSVFGTFSNDSQIFSSPTGAANRTSGIIIGVDPAVGAYVKIGSTLQFFSGMGGTPNKAVIWSCSGGSISTSGLYTPPATPGTYTVTATSQADPTKAYTVKVGADTGSTISGIAGVYTGTTTYAGTDPRTYPVSVFTDGTNTYLKITGVNTYSGANNAVATGTLMGRTFQGTFQEYNPSYYDSNGESVSMVFEQQANGFMTLSGGYLTVHGFPSTGGGVSYSGSPVWAAFSGTVSPSQVDVAVVPHLQDGYYGTSYSYGWPEPHVLSGTANSFKGLVCGSTNTSVNWTAISGSSGAVPATAFSSTTSASTVFTVPEESTKGVNYSIRATSAADTTKSDAASFPVDTTSGLITSTASTVYLTKGLDMEGVPHFYYPSTSDLSVSFVQLPSNDATWTILGSGDTGSLTLDNPLYSHSSATYNPGSTPGVYTVQATSEWDVARSATTNITVVEAPPQIIYLSINKTQFASGDAVILSWLGAWAFNTPTPTVTLTILDQIANTSQTVDVSNQTSYTCNPTHSTTFTFTVTSASGMQGTRSLTASVDVTQGASLYVTPNPVPFQSGMSASVFYTQGSARLSVQTDPYTWTDLGPATSGAGIPIASSLVPWTSLFYVSVQATLTDSVGNIGTLTTLVPIGPKIFSFTSSVPGLLTSNLQPVGLTWSINSANRAATLSLVATNSKGSFYVPLSSGGATSITVNPTETTTYTLTATTYTYGSYGAPMTDQASLTILVSDTVAALSITPTSVTLPPGASQAFTASILAAPGKDGMTWSYSGGSISGGATSATWVAPQTEGKYTVTVASVVNPALTATSTITVSKSAGTLPPPSFDVLSLASGPSPQGPGHVLLSWSTVGATTITLQDSNGFQVDVTGQTSYDVTPIGTTIYTLTITDGKSYISRTLTIPGAGYAIAVVPAQVSMLTGVSFKFGYSIYAPSNQVNWTCNGGTIAADGTFTAPTTAGTYIVTATLVDDPSKTSSATVTVNDVSLIILPSYLALTTGQSFSFGYQALTYSDDRPTWSASAGSITSSGVFTAPLIPGTVTITLTSSKDLTKTAIATVEVKSIDLMILPSVLWVLPQGQYQLAAGTSLGPVNWSVVEANGGSIDANGIYTAPNAVGTFTIKATSALDSSRFATATAIVATSGGGNWGPGSGGGGTFSPQNFGVSVEPAMSTVDAGTYQSLHATVLGNDDQSVTWQVAGGTVKATVDDQGVFTAHEPGIYTVVATSKVNSAWQGSALLVVESSVKGLRNVPAELDLEGYSVTVLKDGKVLLVGGQDTRVIDTDPAKGYRGTAYLYDPGTKAFTATGSLIQARAGHMATLLADGRVLIAGGMGYFKWPTDPNAFVQEQPVKWGEIYNPATGQFEALPTPPDHPLYPAGSMRSAHGSTGQAATLFNGQVLMVGGPSGAQTYWPFDLFNPTTNLFDLTDIVTGNIANQELFQTREGGAVVALDDGRALLTGGSRTYSVNETYPCGMRSCVLNEVRIFDPQSPSALSTVTGMMQARSGHTMTKLPNGKILITGGSDHFTLASTSTFLPNPTATAEIYDPATGTFTPTGSMKWARSEHAAILLPTGQVMVAGGYLSATWDGTGTIWSYPTETELYDPDTGTFSVIDKLAFGLDRPKLALIQGGGVFVGGKPIVTASAGTPAGATLASGSKVVQPMIAPLASGALGWLSALSVLGLTRPEEMGVDFATINQGVERYLDDTDQANGRKEQGQGWATTMPWKAEVPKLANRPTRFRIYLKGLGDISKVKVRVYKGANQDLLNQDFLVKAGRKNVFGGPADANGLVSFVLDENQTLPDSGSTSLTLNLYVEPDPDRTYIKDEVLRKNLTYDKPFVFQLSNPMTVYLIPIAYRYDTGTKDALGNSILRTEPSPLNETYRIAFEKAAKEFFPVSFGKLSVLNDPVALADPANALNYVWDETNNDLAGNPRGKLYSLFNGTERWTQLGLDFFTSFGGNIKYYQLMNDINPIGKYVCAVLPKVLNHSIKQDSVRPTEGVGTAGITFKLDGIKSHFSLAVGELKALQGGRPTDALHELGHAHGSSHAPWNSIDDFDAYWKNNLCGFSPEVYKNGRIGVIGRSVMTQETFDKIIDSDDDPLKFRDLMGYAWPTISMPSGTLKINEMYWVSDYSFRNFFKHEKDPTFVPSPGGQ
ncbi:hypothetical protein [Geothrix oryzisoli]|uniref:hypothetical protein n=1 Tax=Geothrix oryzisoli TaxID=2922721 RepID=UPI001FAD601F|nr:hypothetical protein [Geothrix oryzisoli]